MGVNKEMSVCNDCKYYYRDDNYCTELYTECNYNDNVCELFKLGRFNNRFYIKAEPIGYSTGEYYILIDLERELVDNNDNYLSFKYSDDAELICTFLNKQHKRLHQLQLWVNEKYYENKIEKEYWSKHTPLTD